MAIMFITIRINILYISLIYFFLIIYFIALRKRNPLNIGETIFRRLRKRFPFNIGETILRRGSILGLLLILR